MFSFVFNFEINLKDALETPALIAILVFVVIFAVKQRHRRRTRLFMDKRLNTSACCSKPIPVENEEKSGNNSSWSGIMTADDTELQEINIFNDEQRRISQEHTLAEHYHDHPKSQEERKKFSVEKSSVLPYYEKKKFSILSKLL